MCDKQVVTKGQEQTTNLRGLSSQKSLNPIFFRGEGLKQRHAVQL
jgi:hypothetical protein